MNLDQILDRHADALPLLLALCRAFYLEALPGPGAVRLDGAECTRLQVHVSLWACLCGPVGVC